MIFAGAACVARADILTPTAVVFASNGEDSAPALIDDSQLSSPLSASSTHDESAGRWTTLGSIRAEVVLDLGRSVDLTKIYVWNFQGDTSQGMKDVEIQVSPGSDYSTAQFTAVARISLKEGGENAQAFDLVATDARLVRVKGLSNWGHGFAVGLGAVRFETGDISGSVPTVGLVSPAQGSVAPLGSDLEIVAQVADADNDIAKVEFFDGATLIGTATSAPYSAMVAGGLTFGEHEIRAQATDNTGKVGWWTVTINVREEVGGRIIQIDDEADIGDGVNQI
ncbi:MAG: Ig-like domain-containing protein, partial [Verrucomicrobiales bacterium]|nr:Ig-like domain-containing protein [Verrucomicrobiales bacterium]